ncbi:sigma-70 family RNA polymerase sigma factor [uncultured Alistipes sp.]|uniref:RNA polymerase sigma factor n=1 Tax=uncultured Alistipes sp. TaxID=538949 RepID=UPI0026239E6C|nr:sigma-70 family RNA polymerase sigma factor [uncultured Alistipes sp.]
MTEKELIRRCCQRDPVAQRELYETHAPKMFGVCYRYVCDREIAKDLLHDGFITVFAKIGTFRGEGSFEGWMRRVFVTTALGYLRKNDVFRESDREDVLLQFGSCDASAVERMEAEEIVACIARLPHGYRTVLNLFAVEGYSHGEIAEMLGISEGTSRSQYLRAKNHLYRMLERQEML